MKNILYLGSDHAAFEEKEELEKFLKQLGFEVHDLGTHSLERANYADYAKLVALEVAANKGRGILICGSGIGVSMAANRFKNVRAALCRSEEDAKMSRLHNNANILCMGSRTTPIELIKKMSKVWLETDYEGGRHEERINSFNGLGQ